MARQYAPKAVLRQLPLDLLRRFLYHQDITTGPDWGDAFSPHTNCATER
jgi:hypothetical protein